MKPIEFSGQNVIIAKDQPECLPLPAHVANGVATFCWRLTLRERFQLLLHGLLWHQVQTFGGPLQPQLLSTENPVARTHTQFD